MSAIFCQIWQIGAGFHGGPAPINAGKCLCPWDFWRVCAGGMVLGNGEAGRFPGRGRVFFQETPVLRMLHDPRSGETSYLLADMESAEAVLIDPRGGDLPVLTALLDDARLRLRWVLRTHQHDDQRPGEWAALSRLGAPLVQGEPRDGAHVARDDERLVFGHECVRVLATPGHTAHCLSFQWRDRVFCGGLLVVGACPYQPVPADVGALWDSATRRVFTLPDETLLYAGYDARGQTVSTVMAQRRWHPLLGGCTRDDFLARVATPSLETA